MQTCLHSSCSLPFKGRNYSIKIATCLLSGQKWPINLSGDLSGDQQLSSDDAMVLC